ncbi:MAG: hypothetical protein RDV41_06585 [Planctomycetota bacterium]|nr:hypothetical protein [Planctomycetota bacterium]
MPKSPGAVPAEAKNVLQKFLDAAERKDMETMRGCVNRATLESGKLDAAASEGMTFVMGDARMEDDKVIIPIRSYLPDAPKSSPPVMELPALMVKEDGQWKFDLKGSVDRLLGGVENVMEQVAGAVAQVMEGVGTAMAEGLSKAFGDATAGEGEAPAEPPADWSQAELKPSSDERRPLPETEPLIRTQTAIKKAVGSFIEFRAAMKDLLQRAGSDDRNVLENWFEEKLFAGWAAMLARAANEVPLKDRLYAVRIESASTPQNRILALDGSVLVYRMCLPSDFGYFSDDDIERILPGVLAGLPETIDARLAGWRTLPNDEEHPTVELYERHTAPRYMRRLSELLGKPIALDADWAAVRETALGRTLALWGLNRVYGAVALLCMSKEKRERLAFNLKRIRLMLGTDVTNTEMQYESGTLALALSFYGEDKPGYYEYEIAQFLGGAM